MPMAHLHPLTHDQLLRARLGAAYAYLAEVAGDADLVSPEVRAHVLAALGHIMEARAQLAQQHTEAARDGCTSRLYGRDTPSRQERKEGEEASDS